MAATTHPAMKGANVLLLSLARGEPPHLSTEAKIALRALLGRASLGLPCCLLSRCFLGHWLLALGAVREFWAELEFFSTQTLT